MNDWIKDEIEKRNKFYKKMGKCLGYISSTCCNCKRLRVEKYSSGAEICEKCGVDQKTKITYENEFGSLLEFER